MQSAFIAAIHSKNKVRLTFYSKEDGVNLIRTCAPMDIAPSKRAADKTERFHLWDYDSDSKQHTLSLLPHQVVSIETLEATFNPSDFMSWPPSWTVARDWGPGYS
jgi:hypothetical protein